MPTRPTKSKAKKYNSIREYYRTSDKDKKTIAHQIIYWDGKSSKRERVETTDLDEALRILNQRRDEVSRKKLQLEEQEVFDDQTLTVDEVATEYFYTRKKRGNIQRDKKKYVQHIGDKLYKVIDSDNKRGWKLTPEVDEYTVTLKAKTSTGTRQEVRYYKRSEENGLTSVGTVLIKDLDADYIAKLITALEKKQLSDKTISSAINLLKAIVNHAIAEGYITRNPFLNKKTKVEVKESHTMRLFSEKEIDSIFEEAKELDERVFILFNMLYYTGQRPQSIILLNIKDIDLAQRRITIASIKGQAETFVPISDKLYPLLKVWIKGKKPDDRLFDIEYVTFQMKTQKIFEKYNKGLDYKKDRNKWASMYTFRHTSATVMLTKTKNIKAVQSVLNHSDQRMTARYAKIIDEVKREGVNVL